MFFMNQTKPYAVAKVGGNENYPKIEGTVSFYDVYGGTFVVANLRNMPDGQNFYAFHVHDGNSCVPMQEGGHYNPTNQTHPQHAGDMPPLLVNDGMAFSAFYTNRFYPEDIVGKVVVIHANADDFKSQPSGNPGTMIACGKILERQ